MKRTKGLLLLLIASITQGTLIYCCNSEIEYQWKAIDLDIERGFLSEEGYFFSEKLYSLEPKPLEITKLDEIPKILNATTSPYPLKVLSARWKIVKTFEEDNPVEWGYQLLLQNEFKTDSIYVKIRNIYIELIDKDGFVVEKYNESFDNPFIFSTSIYKDTVPTKFKNTFVLSLANAKRVKNCKMLINVSLNKNYSEKKK